MVRALKLHGPLLLDKIVPVFHKVDFFKKEVGVGHARFSEQLSCSFLELVVRALDLLDVNALFLVHAGEPGVDNLLLVWAHAADCVEELLSPHYLRRHYHLVDQRKTVLSLHVARTASSGLWVSAELQVPVGGLVQALDPGLQFVFDEHPLFVPAQLLVRIKFLKKHSQLVLHTQDALGFFFLSGLFPLAVSAFLRFALFGGFWCLFTLLVLLVSFFDCLGGFGEGFEQLLRCSRRGVALKRKNNFHCGQLSTY